MELNMGWKNVHAPSGADLRAAHIPERKREVSLAAIPDGLPYKRFIVKYITDLEQNVRDGIGLILWGPYRSGKSSIACLIAKEVMSHYASAFYIESPLLMDGWLEKDGATDPAKRRILRSHLLVLDDAGQEHGKEYTKAIVDFVIRYRAERQGATILTTNMNPGELEKEYSKKFMTIAQTCMFPIHVEGKDWGEDEQGRVASRFS